MAIKLLPHQEQLKEKLKGQHGVVVGWDLGSGKTIGSIAAADQFGKATAIVPDSLRENFKKELKAYKPKNRFEVESYERFTKHTPGDLQGRTLIFDESHRLRTSKSLRSQKAQAVAGKANKTILLTGTPIQNEPSEIAPLINVAAGRKVLPTDKREFNKEYVYHERSNPNVFLRMLGAKRKDEYHAKNLDKFQAKVSPYYVHYKPVNDLNAPKVHNIDVKVEMTPLQTEVYHTLEKKLPGEVRKSIEQSLPVDKRDIGKLNAFLSATRQVANTSERFYNAGKTQYSPKLLNIAKNVKNSPGNALIYSNYLEAGTKPLSELLTAANVPHGVFTGEINDKEKKSLVNAYNKGKIKALIVSSSGGEGLDLKNTRQVHITEPHWNEAKIDQVVGRSIRFGSHTKLKPEDRTVDIFRYESMLPEARKGFLWTRKERPVSADQYLDNMSKKKERLNEEFMSTLKKVGFTKHAMDMDFLPFVDDIAGFAIKLFRKQQGPTLPGTPPQQKPNQPQAPNINRLTRPMGM